MIEKGTVNMKNNIIIVENDIANRRGNNDYICMTTNELV